MLTAMRRASSLVSTFACRASRIDVRDCLIVGVSHDVAARYLAGAPWRREAAGVHCRPCSGSSTLSCRHHDASIRQCVLRSLRASATATGAKDGCMEGLPFAMISLHRWCISLMHSLQT
jgi:hypothetical protein